MNTLVVGAYWGDEGKGKIVDLLAADADWIVRFNGGDNAGHTIVADGKKVVLHVLPSGVLQGKNVLIGPDVFFNPESFLKDLKEVEDKGFEIKGRILIDLRAHVIMPYHVALDRKKEEGGSIGTTRRGIGPAAKDKAERTTDITISDLIGETFSGRLKEVVREKEKELSYKEAFGPESNLDAYCEKVHEAYSRYAGKIRQYAGDGTQILNAQLREGKKILVEGAQGTLLDVVHGTRPYVTSSNTTAGGAAANLGIDLRTFRIIGIAKAYPTRVGRGPFPTELGDCENGKKDADQQTLTDEEKRKASEGDEALLGRWIREDGHEYGATTGRPRRTGHPDFAALKYCAMINGIDEWVITKLDILGGKKFRASVSYRKENQTTEELPFRLDGWEPVYSEKTYFWESMSDMECGEAVINGYEALPEGMKGYVKDLVEYTARPVSMISLSPKREITVIKGVLEATKRYLKK